MDYAIEKFKNDFRYGFAFDAVYELLKLLQKWFISVVVKNVVRVFQQHLIEINMKKRKDIGQK